MSTFQRFLNKESSSRKAQSAMEFMVMASVAMVMFASLYSVFVQRKRVSFEKREVLWAERIVEKTAYNMDIALVQGEGFQTSFSLPSGIAGQDYNITITGTDSGTLIFLDWRDKSVSKLAAASNVTGDVKPGINTIEHRGDRLHVSQS